jgi:hypothetical protein
MIPRPAVIHCTSPFSNLTSVTVRHSNRRGRDSQARIAVGVFVSYHTSQEIRYGRLPTVH